MGGITGDFMAPIWPDGRTVGFGDDVGVESSMKATNWPWVYEVPGFDSSQENDYSITWTDSEITWTINGRHVTTYTKKSENNWINSPVVSHPKALSVVKLTLNCYRTSASVSGLLVK